MPGTLIKLRHVEASDLPFLRMLFAACRPELAELPLPPAQRAAVLDMQFQLQHDAYRQCEGIASLLLVRRGEPIGRLVLQRSPARYALVDIALLPNWRRHGIGAAVIGDFLQEAADAGKAVHLHVMHGNPAQRLYARLGFEVTADDGVMRQMAKMP
jgi:ribosomal protein S18 acetylase RimI-like enzyme